MTYPAENPVIYRMALNQKREIIVYDQTSPFHIGQKKTIGELRKALDSYGSRCKGSIYVHTYLYDRTTLRKKLQSKPGIFIINQLADCVEITVKTDRKSVKELFESLNSA